MDESLFTEPRDDVPCPWYWHSPDPESTEYEVTALVGALVTALQPDLVVETGTALGHTAVVIGEALARNGHGYLVSIENDPDRVRTAGYRCAGLPVHLLCGDSLLWTTEDEIGLLFVDANADDRANEVRHFAPMLSDGAVIVVHDTGPHKHMRGLIDELAVEGLISDPLHLPTPRGVSLLQLARP